MKFVVGLSVLLTFYLMGEGVTQLIPMIPLTGSLWGMILLFLALSSGLVKESWLAQASESLISLMGLFFVPVGVGILAYKSLVTENVLPIIAAIIVGSVATFLIVGGTAQWLRRSS